MPEPAGTGCRAVRSCCAPRPRTCRLRRRQLAQLPAFEAGVAHAQAAPPGTVLLSVFLDGGVDSLSVLAPVGTRPTGGCARARVGTGRAFAEDPRLAGIRPPAARRPARRGQGLRAARGRLHRRGPVALHVAPLLGGRRARPAPADGLAGRVLDRVGTADNPLQGVSLGRPARPALATARHPVRRSTSPRTSASGRPAPGARRGPRRAGVHAGLAGRCSARATPRSPRRRGPPRSPAASATRSPRSAPTASRLTRPRPPTRGRRMRFRAGSPASPRCSPPACRSAPPPSAPGAWDTHANQADALPKNLKLTFDSLLAFQRDLEARGLADRVLTLVWSEFGRRAAENGSGTDHGAAGVGLLIGTRASGRMIGEFPVLQARQGRQRARDLGFPRALRRDLRRLVRRRSRRGAAEPRHRAAGDPQ